MRQLPDLPDLDQLRRQARELRRAAAAGDRDAARRLRAVSGEPTLWAAQLTLAREHGFLSWARLRAEPLVIRPVSSLAELASAFDFLGAWVTPSVTHEDRRFKELASRFPEDRFLMLVVEDRGRMVGGLLACRRDSAVTLRLFAFEHGVQEEVVLTRLLGAVEAQARRLGATEVFEGGVDDAARPLYQRLGYRGRNPMRKQLLPLPGRARDALLRRIPPPVA